MFHTIFNNMHLFLQQKNELLKELKAEIFTGGLFFKGLFSAPLYLRCCIIDLKTLREFCNFFSGPQIENIGNHSPFGDKINKSN